MRLRPRRGSLVIWSSSGVPESRSWAWRPARPGRIRWWLRVGALLTVIGLRWVARSARARWEPVFLGIGTALMIIGFALPSAFVAFLLGMLVLVITLLKGIARKGRPAGQAADCWQWRS
jgi:hypothetical protein